MQTRSRSGGGRMRPAVRMRPACDASRGDLTPARYRTGHGVVALAAAVPDRASPASLVRLTGSGLGCDDWPNCNATRARRRVVQARRDRAGQPAVHRPRLGRRDRRRARRAAPHATPPRPDAAVARPRRRRDRPDRARRHHGARRPPPGRGAGPLPAVDGARRERRRAPPPRRRCPTTPSQSARARVGRPLAVHAWVVLAGDGRRARPRHDRHRRRPARRRRGRPAVRRSRSPPPCALHSIAVWVAVALVARARAGASAARPPQRARARAARSPRGSASRSLQAAVGYIQYFSDVPAVLVFVHVAGATALWAVTVWLVVAIVDGPRPPCDRRRQLARLLTNVGALVDHG